MLNNTKSATSQKKIQIDSIKVLYEIPDSLLMLKSPPKKLFYQGNITLLNNTKIAIVGTRNPNPYTRTMTALLAQKLSKYATIVSGGAIGVDIIAHINSFPNTIMVSPSSLDIIYPKENTKIIQNIAQNALIISEYEKQYTPHKYSFLERNRIVIALSDIVILPQGDVKSGTSASARMALELQKPIFTLPHRYNESALTNKLLSQNKAKAIYDIDEFIKENITTSETRFTLDSKKRAESINDDILAFCANAPSFEDAFKKFGNRLLEYEFLGLLVRENSTIRTK